MKGEKAKDIDKLRRELIKISIFSAPVVSFIMPLKRAQAVTEPGGGDLPAPRFEKLKSKKKDRRRIFEKSPFEKSISKNPFRNPIRSNSAQERKEFNKEED